MIELRSNCMPYLIVLIHVVNLFDDDYLNNLKLNYPLCNLLKCLPF